MDDSVNAYRAQFLRDKLVEYAGVVFLLDLNQPPVPSADTIFEWLQEFEESQV